MATYPSPPKGERASVRGPRTALGAKALARGFTLLEVMVAAVLLIVALVGSLALVLGMAKGSRSTRARDAAYFLAQQTLDQFEAIPIAQLPTTNLINPPAGSPAGTVSTGNPVCYPMGEDALIDHPLTASLGAGACLGLPGAPATGSPAAYYVRSQVCCTGTLFGGASPTGCTTFPTNSVGLPASLNTFGQNGASCNIQVEVTWPFEPTTGGVTVANLFSTTASSALNFQNHIVTSMVRSQ